MIGQYLNNQLKIDRLYSSYLISTDDTKQALSELKSFLQKNFLKNVDADIASDYHLVQRKDSKVRDVVVDQIRDLQIFLSKTSIITGYKFGVIYEADKMNLNAANSCLKILEEPPKNSYLFLVTNNDSAIISTIRSRCAKINYTYQLPSTEELNKDFIIPLLKNTEINQHLDFIKKFSGKDRDLWDEFIRIIELILVKFSKKSVGITIGLSEYEQQLFDQLKSRSPIYIEQKYQEIKKIINNTNKYDLDMRCNVALLVDKMRY